MRKKLFSLMLGVVVALASCSQEEVLNNDSAKKSVMFTLETEQPVTRAATATRYVVAVYDEQGQNKVVSEQEYATGTISILLNPGTYTFLFWADNGNTNYLATDLTNIQVASTATNEEAFFAKKQLTVTSGTDQTVTLTRAVAQITLKENDILLAGTVKASYKARTFSVMAEAATATATSVTKELSVANPLDGKQTPAEIGSFYVLASSAEANLADFTVQYKEEAVKTISNVPVQANYKTNITGKYGAAINQSFTFSLSDTWGDPEKEGSMLKVGTDYTHTVNGTSYDCYVSASTASSATVICKTEQAKAIDKVTAQSAAKAKGGRLAAFEEFKILIDAGIVSKSLHNYYCADYERCWCLSNEIPNHDNNPEQNLAHFIAFDLK